MESEITKMSECNTQAWKRWSVVLLMIGAMAGGYMLLYALSPLQTFLQSEAGWDLATYSRYSSAESFLNVFCCILLVAGVLTDRLGTRFCGLLSGFLMLAGGALNFYALTGSFMESQLADWFDTILNFSTSAWNITPFSAGMPASAKLSAIGFMLFGVGMEMAGISASKATVSWFRGKELAIALGVQLAGSRIIVALALWLSPRIAMIGNEASVSRPLGWTLFVLIIGICCWIAFGFIDRYRKEEQEAPDTVWAPLKRLCLNTPRNRLLWLLALVCVAYYASVIPFFRYATAIFQSSMGLQASGAASLIALLPLASALATPFACMIPDYKGKAIPLMIWGALFIIICYMMFAFLLPVIPELWIAYGGIALLGLSSALVSAGLWPLLPRIAPASSLGSAYAGFYWLQAIGLYLTPLLVATFVDDSHVAEPYLYAPAMMLFSALAAISILGAVALSYLNRKENLGLNLPNKVK